MNTIGLFLCIGNRNSSLFDFFRQCYAIAFISNCIRNTIDRSILVDVRIRQHTICIGFQYIEFLTNRYICKRNRTCCCTAANGQCLDICIHIPFIGIAILCEQGKVNSICLCTAFQCLVDSNRTNLLFIANCHHIGSLFGVNDCTRFSICFCFCTICFISYLVSRAAIQQNIAIEIGFKNCNCICLIGLFRFQ